MFYRFLLMVVIVCSSISLSAFSRESTSVSKRFYDTLHSPPKLVFAIDGLSFEAFQYAQSKGLFPSFKHSGKHISLYPSMTEPTWTEMLGGKKLFPLSGKLQSTEASYFDIESMTLKDDPRKVYTRAASPSNFYRAFDYYFNPFIEGLMYFPNESTTDMEFDEMEKDIMTHFDFKSGHYITYISAIDALAHTQKDRLFPALKKLSDKIEKIISSQKSLSPDLTVWIVSDHGNIGNFKEGTLEKHLIPMSFNPIAKRAGLEIKEGVLNQDRDISIPILALGNYANVYFKNLNYRRIFAKEALKDPSVELITYLEITKKDQSELSKSIVILGENQSEARLYWSKKGYAYVSINGNPLSIPAPLLSPSSTSLRWISDEESFKMLAQHSYPDAFFRLVENAKKQVANQGDLIVNLKQNYCLSGSFSQFVKMVRTHGSLAAESSTGVVASTQSDIPSVLRTKSIFPLIGITPEEAFHKCSDLFQKNPLSTLEELKKNSQKGIASRVTDFSNEIIFRRLSKMIQNSVDLLDSDEIKKWMNTYIPLINKINRDSLNAKNKAQSSGSIIDQISGVFKEINLKDLLNHIDEFFAFKETLLLKSKSSSELETQLKDGLFSLPGLSPLQKIEALLDSEKKSASSENLSPSINLLRKVAMKLYSTPTFINKILTLPEFDFEKDPRDLEFAEKWIKTEKDYFKNHPEGFSDKKDIFQKLFSEIFEERKLFHRLSPATFPLLYNAPLKDVTIVFVPGIYNELFDHEIFAEGLRSLNENLGLRTLVAEVDGRCSTQYNSKLIYNQLIEDTQKRIERGYKKPTYLILGYSKGGVDATESLLIDPAFTRSQIIGLVSIASPHLGTSILDTVDLPKLIGAEAGERKIPTACLYQSGSQSIRRNAREKFWSDALGKVAGLTRLYSFSFSTSIENAHPWMKITKNIARFQTPNDGVVTVESSRFPDNLGAIDFGVIEADHLAGIVASSFPQSAFLEAIVLSLSELNVFDSENIQNWYNYISPKISELSENFNRRRMGSEMLRASQISHINIANIIGPLPQKMTSTSISNEEELNWYSEIARETEILKTPFNCLEDKKLQIFTDQLQKNLKGTDLEMLPFSLSCSTPRKGLILKIQTYTPSGWEIWKSPVEKSYLVRNLDHLNTVLLSYGLKNGKNLLAPQESPLSSLPSEKRTLFNLPATQLHWNLEDQIELKAFNSKLESTSVSPLFPSDYKDGISLRFDQNDTKKIRSEFQFSYETTAPGNVDNNPDLFYPVLDKTMETPSVVLRMRSRDNSIRMTTASMRFKASDFPRFNLDFKVTEGPECADSVKGGSGKDDSAFQIWLTVRDSSLVSDRSKFKAGNDVKIFGYYWAESGGIKVEKNQFVENYYSNKNFVVTVLPKAIAVVLGVSPKEKNQWIHLNRNLVEDLKVAFPESNPNNLEIVGLTLQSDSNDTHTRSEAFLKSFSFKP